MIVAWLLFALVTGGALSTAAVAADRLVAGARRARRFVWFAALVVTAVWPAVAYFAAATAHLRGSNRGALQAIGAHRLPTLIVPAFENVLGTFVTSATARSLDAALLTLWGLASAVLLTRLIASALTVARRRRAWPIATVDGHRVRISPDLGPAVVGLAPAEVVLPRWALALDPRERALVLRHEAEHRDAGDPSLLLAAALLVACVPWHPALWWQARRLRLAVELDCDARVLQHEPHPTGYARLLLAIAERRDVPTMSLTPALLGMFDRPVRPSHLERRITAMRLTSRSTPRMHRVTLGAATFAAVAVACTVESPDRPTAPAVSTAPAAVRATPALKPQQGPFFEFQVERQASAIPGGLTFHYPDALQGTKRSGNVLLQFVVDTAGHVDLGTVRVLSSSDPAFTAAVEAALPTARFEPALVGGRPVRQLIQLPVWFSAPGKPFPGAD